MSGALLARERRAAILPRDRDARLAAQERLDPVADGVDAPVALADPQGVQARELVGPAVGRQQRAGDVARVLVGEVLAAGDGVAGLLRQGGLLGRVRGTAPVGGAGDALLAGLAARGGGDDDLLAVLH
jgi:hypothetical protein